MAHVVARTYDGLAPVEQAEFDALATAVGPPSTLTLGDLADGPPPGWANIGDVLSWQGIWVPTAPPTGGVNQLDQLADTQVGPLSDGDVLTFDTGAMKWRNEQPATVPTTLAALTGDVSIGSPAAGQVLKYFGTGINRWMNVALGSWRTFGWTDIDTTVVPTGSQYLVYNGTTSRWTPTTIVNTWTVAGATDVVLTGLANGSVLAWNSGTSKWVPVANPSTIAAQTDVQLTSIANGQALTWNSGTSKFVNTTLSSSVATLTDVVLTGVANGQALVWNSGTSKWVNGSVSSSLATLSDAQLTSVADGNVLQYSSTAAKWVNSTALSGLLAREPLSTLLPATATLGATQTAAIAYGTAAPTEGGVTANALASEDAAPMAWIDRSGTATTVVASVSAVSSSGLSGSVPSNHSNLYSSTLTGSAQKVQLSVAGGPSGRVNLDFGSGGVLLPRVGAIRLLVTAPGTDGFASYEFWATNNSAAMTDTAVTGLAGAGYKLLGSATGGLSTSLNTTLDAASTGPYRYITIVFVWGHVSIFDLWHITDIKVAVYSGGGYIPQTVVSGDLSFSRGATSGAPILTNTLGTSEPLVAAADRVGLYALYRDILPTVTARHVVRVGRWTLSSGGEEDRELIFHCDTGAGFVVRHSQAGGGNRLLVRTSSSQGLWMGLNLDTTTDTSGFVLCAPVATPGDPSDILFAVDNAGNVLAAQSFLPSTYLGQLNFWT